MIYRISLVHINLEVGDERGGVTEAYVNHSTRSTKNGHQLMLNMSSNTMKSGGCSFTGADSNHSDLDASVTRKVESSKMAEPKKATKSSEYMKTSTTTTTHQPRH
ncbi:hypothetical protein L1887_19367 [Cichorium endivia]|nr:hypothetical protein L1887_19367 [Cichorium endivia]